MSHLTSEVLWDAAKSPTAEQAEHLNGCAECQAKVMQVRSAQASLIPTPVPPLPMTSARRIGRALEEAAQKELVKKPLFAWWPLSFSPNWALAAVAAVLLAVLAARLMAPPPTLPEPIARHETPPAPIAMPAPVPPAPTPVAPAPAPKPQLAAAVMTARGAKKGDAPLDTKAELKAGDTVATSKSGELWMKLPEGSRAGLTPGSKLSIGSLTADQLALELDEGSVVVVARHLPERELKVTVGELEVRDVGTRFVVSRELNRAMVAVVEGVVEVKAPGETRQVKAGHIVRWQEGQLTEETYTPVQLAPKSIIPAKEAKASETPSIPSQPQTKLEVEPPTTPVAEAAKETAKPDGSNPDEWGKYAPADTTGRPPEPPLQGKPVPAVGGTADASTSTVAVKEPEKKDEKAEEPEDDSPPGPIDLLKMGIRGGVKLAKKLTSNSPRQREVREIGELTDGGNCEETLKRADEWLQADPSESSEEPTWKRQVLVNKMRCYRILHRDTEADAIKKELQK
jgi:hypothetical protein